MLACTVVHFSPTVLFHNIHSTLLLYFLYGYKKVICNLRHYPVNLQHINQIEGRFWFSWQLSKSLEAESYRRIHHVSPKTFLAHKLWNNILLCVGMIHIYGFHKPLNVIPSFLLIFPFSFGFDGQRISLALRHLEKKVTTCIGAEIFMYFSNHMALPTTKCLPSLQY